MLTSSPSKVDRALEFLGGVKWVKSLIPMSKKFLFFRYEEGTYHDGFLFTEKEEESGKIISVFLSVSVPIP